MKSRHTGVVVSDTVGASGVVTGVTSVVTTAGLQRVVIITGVAGGQAETSLVNIAVTVAMVSVLSVSPLSFATIDLAHIAGAVVVTPIVRGGVGLAGAP